MKTLREIRAFAYEIRAPLVVAVLYLLSMGMVLLLGVCK